MTADARFRNTLKTLIAALGSSDPARRQQARQTIRDTLAVNQKSWNDLITSLRFRGARDSGCNSPGPLGSHVGFLQQRYSLTMDAVLGVDLGDIVRHQTRQPRAVRQV